MIALISLDFIDDEVDNPMVLAVMERLGFKQRLRRGRLPDTTIAGAVAKGTIAIAVAVKIESALRRHRPRPIRLARIAVALAVDGDEATCFVDLEHLREQRRLGARRRRRP